MNLTIGIIGTGHIGGTLAKYFSNAGYKTLISNSKGAGSLSDIAGELGPNVIASSATEAADADVVVLSVPWAKLEDTVKTLPDLKNKIVIDTTNNILATSPALKLADLHGRTSGEVVAALLPGARVVKAFNTLYFKMLEQNPREASGKRVIVFSGDDPEAKATVSDLILRIGFAPVDLGTLANGGLLQGVGARLSSINLIKSDDLVQKTIAVVRRSIEEVQGKGDFGIFDEIFADDFVDHTPQPGGFAADKQGVRQLYTAIRTAIPDFHAVIHWQNSDGERVTTFKTYYGTHEGLLFGINGTGRKIHFETVDVMRVKDGKITDHWGVANLLSLMQQLGVLPEIENQDS